MPYIFLDESGQFIKSAKEKSFVIGSFTVGDVRRTHKSFRTWCRTRFPRRLRHRAEIKFSDSNINESLRVRTLQYIANLDVRICYTHLFCENIPEEFRAKASIQIL